jgi:hypothetical protein
MKCEGNNNYYPLEMDDRTKSLIFKDKFEYFCKVLLLIYITAQVCSRNNHINYNIDLLQLLQVSK